MQNFEELKTIVRPVDQRWFQKKYADKLLNRNLMFTAQPASCFQFRFR